MPPTFILFVYTSYSFQVFGERLACSCQLCVLGAHSPLFGTLGVIVCCVCWELILLCWEYWELLFVVCVGSSFSFVGNTGCYCLLCVLGAHSSLFGMLGVIVCVCWELILLCLECWVLLFVFSAGRLFLFGVNDGPCLLFVLGGYFLCSHQITTGRPNNFCPKLYV